MKKLLTILLSLCMCLSLGMALTACDFIFDEPEHTHTYTETVATDEYLKTEATCLSKAVYYKSCGCGEKGAETFEGDFAEHNFSSEWTKGDGKHWHRCQTVGCSAISNEEAHAYIDGACVCGELEPVVDINMVSQAQWEAAFEFENVTIKQYLVISQGQNILVGTYLLNGSDAAMSYEGTTIPMEGYADFIRTDFDFSDCYNDAEYQDNKYFVNSFDVYGDGSYIYEDVYLTFENGVLKSITATIKEEVPEYDNDYNEIGTTVDTSSCFIEFVEYGETEIVFPSLPISKTEWENAFDIENLNNVTITANIPNIQEQIYVANGMEKVTVTGYSNIELYCIDSTWYTYNVSEDTYAETDVFGQEYPFTTLIESFKNLFSLMPNMYSLMSYDEDEGIYYYLMDGNGYSVVIDNGKVINFTQTIILDDETSVYSYALTNYATTNVAVPFDHTHVCSFQENVSDDFLIEEATCTSKALYIKSCSCGKTSSDTFYYGLLLQHVLEEEIVEDRYLFSEATCVQPAKYKKSCLCGASSNGNSVVLFSSGNINPNNHNFATSYQNDEEEHWKECRNSGCMVTTDKQAHIFVKGECECGLDEYSITISYDESVKSISLSQQITAELFGASARDNRGRVLEIDVSLKDGCELCGGNLITVVLTSTYGTNSETVEIENIKVYDLPTIDYLDIRHLSVDEDPLTIKDYYTVTFDINLDIEEQYYSLPEPQIVTTTNGLKYVTPVIAKNYKFYGWFTTPECEEVWDFSKPVTSDMTLYAGYMGEWASYVTFAYPTEEGTYVSGSVQYNRNKNIIFSALKSGKFRIEEYFWSSKSFSDGYFRVYGYEIYIYKVDGTRLINQNGSKIVLTSSPITTKTLELEAGDIVQIIVSDRVENEHISYSFTIYGDNVPVDGGKMNLSDYYNGPEKIFQAKASDSFGNPINVTSELLSGEFVVGGTVTLKLCAIDELGNKKEIIIQDIKIHNESVFSNWISGIEPTCTQNGVKAHYHCEACNKDFDGGRKEITDLTIPANSHNYGELIPEKSATCTQNGVKAHYYCKVCDTNFDENKIEIIDLIIPANGHNYGELIPEKPATCTQNGVRAHYHCVVCDKDFDESKNEIIDLTIFASQDYHSYNENGICNICGEKKPSEGLEYTLYNNGTNYSVTGIGTCIDTHIVIPLTYNGKPVTAINDAFKDCERLVSITIGYSIKSIGGDGFSGCINLEKVNYTGTIDDWAQISFGVYATNPLRYAKNLYINDELVTAANITTATQISSNAFKHCESLISVTIGNNVTYVGLSAFAYCKNLERVTIGNGVKSIADYTFGYCSRLESIEIPDNVKSIGNGAFDHCENLTNVTIGDGVTSVGERAFQYCKSLMTVIIGENVKSIGDSAFYYCDSLMSVTFKNTTGWYRTTSSASYSGDDMIVTNASTNATNIKKYSTFYWKRR